MYGIFAPDERPVLGPPEPVNPAIHWYLYKWVPDYRDAYDAGKIIVYDRDGPENPAPGNPPTPT